MQETSQRVVIRPQQLKLSGASLLVLRSSTTMKVTGLISNMLSASRCRCGLAAVAAPDIHHVAVFGEVNV